MNMPFLPAATTFAGLWAVVLSSYTPLWTASRRAEWGGYVDDWDDAHNFLRNPLLDAPLRQVRDADTAPRLLRKK